MALTAYTSYADVRAALGVTPKELSDDTLALQLYENVLLLAFGKQDAGFQAFLDTTLAVVGPTALQSYFLRLAQVFATYTVAQAAARAMPMFSRQQITDGKASMARFQDNPAQTVLDNLSAQLIGVTDAMMTAYRQANPSSIVISAISRTYMVGSAGFDPVLGA